VDLALFNKVLAKIRPFIESKNQNMARGSPAVTPELKLSMALRWLAGGSYLDIYQMHGVSLPEFNKALWETLEAIDQHYKVRSVSCYDESYDSLADIEQ